MRWNKKNIIVSMLVLIIACAGCNNGGNEKETPTIKVGSSTLPPTLTIVPSEQLPTPTMTEEERWDAEEQKRQEEMQELLAPPTQGPEPYSLFDVDKKVGVGDIVTIGEYIHCYNWEYPPIMQIKWRVLKIEANKALIISLFNLDVLAYNAERTEGMGENGLACTWEKSNVRSWLNNSFRKYAFSEKEKECILLTEVHTPNNSIYGTEGGRNTTDYLFLLSIEEVEEFFLSDTDRMTQIVPDITELDDVYIGHQPNTTDYYDWWLRSPGKTAEHAACVGRFGDIVLEGEWVEDVQVSVRPAMWIDLEKVKEIGLELEAE